MMHLDEAINSIFYQLLEYIIAPFVLVIFTHFILSKEDKFKGLGNYSIELNFVSLYSNLLFYFSCSAHHHPEHVCTKNCLCIQVQLALLVVCVFGLFLILIHQRIHNISVVSRFLQTIFNWLWAGIMAILLVLIFGINMHLNELSLSFKADDIQNTFSHLVLFFRCPCNFLLLIFILFVILIMVLAWRPPQYGKSAIRFQNLSTDSDITVDKKEKEKNKQLEIALNKMAKPEVRAQSFYHAANFSFENNEIRHALNYVVESKKIAELAGYQERLLLPIRELKMKIHLTLNENEDANAELVEVKEKYAQATGLTKTILKYCVDKLQEVLNNYKPKSPDQ